MNIEAQILYNLKTFWVTKDRRILEIRTLEDTHLLNILKMCKRYTVKLSNYYKNFNDLPDSDKLIIINFFYVFKEGKRRKLITNSFLSSNIMVKDEGYIIERKRLTTRIPKNLKYYFKN